MILHYLHSLQITSNIGWLLYAQDFEEFFRGIRDLSIKNTEHNLYLITMWGEEAQVKNNGSLVPTARSPAVVLNKSADSADTEINFDFDKLLASR